MNTDAPLPDAETTFAAEPEFVLMIAGVFLTILVLCFVGYLITQIVKEERAAERSRKEWNKGDD